ncbi:hypothetical protein LINPERHAP1_LOCUS24230 [Linum perenne]
MGNSSPTQKESDGILLQMLRAIVVVRPVNPLPMCSVNVDMRMLFGGIWVLTLLIRIGAATYPLGSNLGPRLLLMPLIVTLASLKTRLSDLLSKLPGIRDLAT